MEAVTYDVALVENGKITWVSWWRDVEPIRGMRLADREGKSHGCESGLVKSGSLRAGQKVKIVESEITIPQYMDIDGRKIRQKDKIMQVRLLEVDNS